VTGSRGFTLIEVTVLIAVVGLLAGLVSSSAGDMLQQSRLMRTREDVGQIAQGVTAFYADNGFFPKTADTVDGRPGSDMLGTLISDAAPPQTTDSSSLWIESRTDVLSAHLMRNDRAYDSRDRMGQLGWAGPYVTGDLAEDAWGHAYMVNVFYLDARNVVVELDGTPLGAVWALSAGPNGVIETPYYQPRDQAAVYGDDVAFRLQ
jgi:prepilin-type N-terminal cleavage/methylation domain-containing protein